MNNGFVIAALSAVVLTACGGGGSNEVPAEPPTPPSTRASIKVVGGGWEAGGGANYAVSLTPDYRNWPDLVAQRLRGEALCNRFVLVGAGTVIGWTAGNAVCTSYAINDHSRSSLTSGPTSLETDDGVSIVGQLQRAAAEGLGANDILLVGTGYAHILEARSALSLIGGLGPESERIVVANYIERLERLLGAGEVNRLLPTEQRTLVTVIDLYMKALAGRLADAIDRYALQNGVTRVAVLNTIPAHLLTGTAHSAQSMAKLDQWTQSFNTALAQRFATNTKVRVVDGALLVREQIAKPQQYGYANTTTPACASAANQELCSASELAALPAPTESSDKSATWWKSYMVWQWVDSSSSFTTTKHRISQHAQDHVANLVLAEINKAGWK